jgi:biopolymer transport protein ExbD
VTGQLYLDQRPVSREELAAEMKGLGAADPDVTVRVRADERIAYGRLADILRLLHEARIARLALITQEENAP